VALADIWGLSLFFIAIVIIGVGSSLPELSIPIAALSKARPGMPAVNLIGGDIVDSLLPVDLAETIHPLSVKSPLIHFDVPALFALRHGLHKPWTVTIKSA
jgi:cation:H+ antiporter